MDYGRMKMEELSMSMDIEKRKMEELKQALGLDELPDIEDVENMELINKNSLLEKIEDEKLYQQTTIKNIIDEETVYTIRRSDINNIASENLELKAKIECMEQEKKDMERYFEEELKRAEERNMKLREKLDELMAETIIKVRSPQKLYEAEIYFSENAK